MKNFDKFREIGGIYKQLNKNVGPVMRVVTHLLSTMAATFGNSIWTVLFHPVLPELLLPQVVRDHWALNRYNNLHSESLAKKTIQPFSLFNLTKQA